MSDAEQRWPLHWVEDLVRSIKPYIHVRAEDSLLILMPNQAFRLNRTALPLLRHLLAGKPLERILHKLDGREDVRRDLYHFFCDLRAAVAGCLRDDAARRAVEYIPYEPEFSTLPVLSEVALTYRCNLACRFCYAACGPGSERQEMSSAQVVRILKTIRRDAQVPSVSFTGGEPTLRPDLPRLVRAAVRLGLRVNLITNATLIDHEMARRLADAGLTSAQVSVEGPDADVHERLTSVPGSFERTWSGLDALRAAGVKLMTNTTLNGVSAPHAERVVRLLAERGVKRFAMNMLMPCGAAVDDEEVWLRYSEVGPVVRRVQAAARRLEMDFHWYSPTPYCLFNPIAGGLGNKRCAACDGLLSVAPDGELLPCSSYDYGVGNLLRTPFRRLWDSARARFWRGKHYAPPECEGCEMFDPCTAACPLYWRRFGTEELKHDARAARVAGKSRRRPKRPPDLIATAQPASLADLTTACYLSRE